MQPGLCTTTLEGRKAHDSGLGTLPQHTLIEKHGIIHDACCNKRAPSSPSSQLPSHGLQLGVVCACVLTYVSCMCVLTYVCGNTRPTPHNQQPTNTCTYTHSHTAEFALCFYCVQRPSLTPPQETVAEASAEASGSAEASAASGGAVWTDNATWRAWNCSRSSIT